MKLAVATPEGPLEAYAYSGGKAFDTALPCVVFVHGALNDHSVWTLAARWFAHHGWAVLAPDLPGHSRSAGAPLGCRSDPVIPRPRWLDAGGVFRLTETARPDILFLIMPPARSRPSPGRMGP